MSENPILREGRAAVFAAVCVLVAAFGHSAFSPTDIPVWALVSCMAALYVAIRPLTKRERGLPAIVGAMAVVQVALHTAFDSAQRSASSMSDMQAASYVTRTRHLPAAGAWWCGPHAPHGLGQALYHAAGMSGMNGPAAHSMTAGMWSAHIAAASVASWWLWRGESAAWELGRALVILLAVPLRLLTAVLLAWTPPKAAPAVVATAGRVGPGRLLGFSVGRRGPPAVAAFC